MTLYTPCSDACPNVPEWWETWRPLTTIAGASHDRPPQHTCCHAIVARVLLPTSVSRRGAAWIGRGLVSDGDRGRETVSRAKRLWVDNDLIGFTSYVHSLDGYLASVCEVPTEAEAEAYAVVRAYGQPDWTCFAVIREMVRSGRMLPPSWNIGLAERIVGPVDWS